MIIDVHTHIFPDNLAGKALSALRENSGFYITYTDGTAADLLKSMDTAGIGKSFIANIATKPKQAESILEWSKTIRSSRLIPLGSVHPADLNWEKNLEAVKEAGLPGIKLHPMYQNFTIDDRAVYPLYEKCRNLGLFILMHTGFDVAFPGDQRALPEKLARVNTDLPGLTFIAAHWGGWQAWDSVNEHLTGRDIYLDTSFLRELSSDQLSFILRNHPRERILFGSDSPWNIQKEEVDAVRRLELAEKEIDMIFSKNALKLLNSVT